MHRRAPDARRGGEPASAPPCGNRPDGAGGPLPPRRTPRPLYGALPLDDPEVARAERERLQRSFTESLRAQERRKF